MHSTPERPWADVVDAPVTERSEKPRRIGLTMVIDKGLGLNATQDLLDTAAPYIDFIKFAFGTSVLYTSEILAEKVRMIRSYGVDVYPGGTLLELAGLQGQREAFLASAARIGFTAVEVSEGTIELQRRERQRLIKGARRAGLRVISEVGKKDRAARMNPDDVVAQVEEDLDCGAEVVIVEGRDSGRGVGVYDDDGGPREALIEGIVSNVSRPSRLMWEAPIVAQQQYWLRRVGPNVNLGNVQTNDAITLEATRVGLRGDTLRDYVQRYLERV